jgi:hypothetical protein
MQRLRTSSSRKSANGFVACCLARSRIHDSGANPQKTHRLVQRPENLGPLKLLFRGLTRRNA